ncbi:MAG: ImuA family protein [Maritimibacter sp.]
MFLESLSLEKGRVHEAFGRARHLFALLVMREMRGPVFWVRPAWEGARLNGPGMACFADPGRVVFVDAPRPLDLLWTLEEVLRSGEVPLVVGDLDGVPGLTPMRRLQLATETGGGRALGLVLTPEGRAPGAQSRWEMQPDHAAELTRWRLMRERGGGGAPRSWQVVPKGKGFTLL